MEWLKEDPLTGEVKAETVEPKPVKAGATARAKGIIVALPLDVSVALSRLAQDLDEPVHYVIERAVKEFLEGRGVTWWKGPLDQ